MTEKEFLTKIEQLKSIKPSPEWLVQTRQRLSAQIDQEKTSFSFSWQRDFQPLVLIICLGLFFMAGPWLMVQAAQNSVPGDLLYSIKRISEDFQTTIASENSRIQLQMEFASRRLTELKGLNNHPMAQKEKTEKAKEVVSDFKENLSGVSFHLDNVKTKFSKGQAMAVAKKAEAIKKDLAETKEEAPEIIQNELNEAEKKIEEINQQILLVLSSTDGLENEETAPSLDEEVIISLDENGQRDSTNTTSPPTNWEIDDLNDQDIVSSSPSSTREIKEYSKEHSPDPKGSIED